MSRACPYPAWAFVAVLALPAAAQEPAAEPFQGQMSACAPPEYPAAAMRRGAMGTSVIAVLLGPDGVVRASRVEHASGTTKEHGLLDQAALRALSACRFDDPAAPAAPRWQTVSYHWSLSSPPTAPADIAAERERAEHGDAQAQFDVAFRYEFGHPPDAAAALAWYRKAGAGGHVGAQWVLARAYLYGQGAPRDPAEGLHWLELAAAGKHPLAMFTLSHLVRDGKAGPASAERAIALLRGAAEGGVPAAGNELGDAYFQGKGVPQDDAQAVAWYRRAAANGESVAMYKLGVAYEQGIGGPVDAERAAVLYALASRYRNDMARDALAALGKTLAPDVLARAVARAGAWRDGDPLPI